MKGLFKYRLLFIFPLLLGTATAQTKTDSAAHLPDVEVIARIRTMALSPVQILKVERTSPMNNFSVADAIRYFSGVQVKDYGGVGGLKTVNVRNMGTHHVGVFYDGIQLSNAQNGQIDLGRFSLDNLEAISLYNAQKTDVLQPAKDYASASSIYLTSRAPAFPKGKRHQFSATLKTGSFGLLNTSFQWTQRITDSISSDLSAERTMAHGRYKFRYKMLLPNGTTSYDTTAIRKNGDITGVRTEWGLYGKIRNGEWRGKLYNYFSERGLPGFIASNLFKHGQRQWDHNLFLQSAFRKKLSRKHQLLLNMKYAYDFTRYLDADSTSMHTDNRYRQHELYLSAAHEFMLTPHWKTGISADYQYNLLRASLVNFSYPTRHTLLFAIASGLTLKRFSTQGNLLATVVRNQVQMNTAAPSANLITPAVHVSWKPFPSGDLNIRTFYKRIFRMPTFNDLYYTFIGNAMLAPEYTTQYNISFSFSRNLPGKTLKNFDLTADAYYNEVKNKIVAVPTANPFRWMMLNLGFVKITGLETSISSGWRLFGGEAGLKLNYTFQRATDQTSPGDSFFGDQIPYAPLHSFSAAVRAVFGKWQANYSFLYTGERYAQKANIPKNYLPAWYTSDVGMSRSLMIQSSQINISLELNNLLNQYYDVVLNYPMPGRNFRVIVSCNF